VNYHIQPNSCVKPDDRELRDHPLQPKRRFRPDGQAPPLDPRGGSFPMRFAIMLEPQQGISYAEQLAVAQRAEAAGFEAFFRSDHYESFPGPADLATTDAWTVLAGIARETTTIRLGALVSPVTYRLPGPFAKIVTTVDEMSGGRVEVAVGTGWHEMEHARYGIPFPPVAERADMLEETLTILHGLWEEPDGWSYAGRHWNVANALFRAKPVQRPHPPILVGGGGTARGLRIAARYADEFNITDTKRSVIADRYAALDAACLAIGRDPKSIVRSAMIGTLVGSDAAELALRKAAILAGFAIGDGGEAWFAKREQDWIIGTPARAREQVAELAQIGVQRLILQDFVPRDLTMIDLLGREVVAG
jgi:F420-dependent oxidoreductase-like protein